jgi:hypothetical protein
VDPDVDSAGLRFFDDFLFLYTFAMMVLDFFDLEIKKNNLLFYVIKIQKSQQQQKKFVHFARSCRYVSKF